MPQTYQFLQWCLHVEYVIHWTLLFSCRWWRKWRPLLVGSHQRRSRIQRVTVSFCNSCPIFKFMYNLYSWSVIHCFMMTKFKEVSLLYLVWCFAQCGPTQWFKDIAVCADIKVTTSKSHVYWIFIVVPILCYRSLILGMEAHMHVVQWLEFTAGGTAPGRIIRVMVGCVYICIVV